MWIFKQPGIPKASDAQPGRAEPITSPPPQFVNGRSLVDYPDGFEIAEVALGCFWGEEKTYWQLPGVWVTAVGYQGGATPNPTYREVCTGKTGHAESVRVVYEPTLIDYMTVLQTFWESHDPTQGMRQGNDVGTQYRSAIFVQDEAQRAAAETSKAMYQEQLTKAGFGSITTEIVGPPAPTFYFAEDYHQQYLAKNPNGYCPDHSTGVSCPIGLSVSAGGPRRR
jgi:peptide-methionine (S)-S-oxide reductase